MGYLVTSVHWYYRRIQARNHHCPIRQEWDESRLTAVFTPVDLRSNLLKIDIWKLREYGYECCQIWQKLWRHEEGWHVRQKCTLLLFVGKQWNNMAAPWGTKIRRKKKERKKEYLSCRNIDRTTVQSLQREIFALFRCVVVDILRPI